jgi:guanine deaminase
MIFVISTMLPPPKMPSNTGDFADIDILDEIRKDPKDRRISFTETCRSEAVAVWKEFHNMPDRARY